MTGNAQGYEVTYSTLRSEATLWDEQAAALDAVAETAAQLNLNRVQSGVFQMITGGNDAVVAEVMARAREGAVQMAHIAQGLRSTAQNYESVETFTAHAFSTVVDRSSGGK